jgi:predicted dehydrogenase
VRGEFGYWVFEGDWQPAQRPSWNYRKEDDGGIIVDMLCHWRYVLDNLFGGVKSVMCLGATHIPKRWDENGKPYAATADDAAYATFELADGVIARSTAPGARACAATISSRSTSTARWARRWRTDGVPHPGARGNAQARLESRRAADRSISCDTWQLVPANRAYDNAFKVEWELFLKHVVEGGSFQWNLLEGAKGVQLAELGLQSWRERRFVDVPALPV